MAGRCGPRHWGTGIGSNRWRNCSVVFLFGEFHLPRRAYVATGAGWTQTKAHEIDRQHIQGQVMGGPYLTVREGHLLRWTKQLACRGTVRNIDGDGHCGPMRLYTTMDFPRLLANLQRIFPGCPAPTRLTDHGPAQTKGECLLDLIADFGRDYLTSDQIEELTGVAANHLGRELAAPSVRTAMNTYGIVATNAKAVGLEGKRKILAKASVIA